jgi:hypothetical protein
MRLIFGVGSKLFIWDTSVAKVTMRIAGDATEPDDEDDEGFKHIPQDPHSTNGAHLEISPDAIGAYGKRKMGFHGSESAG